MLQDACLTSPEMKGFRVFCRTSSKVPHGLVSTSGIFVQFVGEHYLLEVTMAMNQLERLISWTVSDHAILRLFMPRVVEVLLKQGYTCYHSLPRRKTALGRVVLLRSVLYVWLSTTLGMNWHDSNVCANSTRAVSSTGSDAKQSVRCTSLWHEFTSDERLDDKDSIRVTILELWT